MNHPEVFSGTPQALCDALLFVYRNDMTFQLSQMNYVPSEDAFAKDAFAAQADGMSLTLCFCGVNDEQLPGLALFDGTYADSFNEKVFRHGQLYQLTFLAVFKDENSDIKTFCPPLPGKWAPWETYWQTHTPQEDCVLYAAVNLLPGETASDSLTSLSMPAVNRALAKKQDKPLVFADVTVSEWEEDTTYTNYGYRAMVPLTGATADRIPHVYFSGTDALSGNYAPPPESYNGGIFLYGKTDTEITVSEIVLEATS